MNIFVLDQDPVVAARYHYDKHVVKMPVESAQMLSQVLRASGTRVRGKMYGESHPHHPCTLWASSSLENWEWLRSLSLALIKEHQHRFGLHRVEIETMIRKFPQPRIPSLGLQPFVLAMPEWLKDAGLPPIDSYRVLYLSEKLHLMRWKRRTPPPWVPDSVLSNGYRMTRTIPVFKRIP